MGWWETESSRWQMVIVAQVGAAEGVGGGVFLVQFRAPELGEVKPQFLVVAVGVGGGGSVGSAISISYSEIIAQLRNPRRRVDPTMVFSDVVGRFSCQLINHSVMGIVQATASAAVAGVQRCLVMCANTHFFGADTVLFRSSVELPRAVMELNHIAGRSRREAAGMLANAAWEAAGAEAGMVQAQGGAGFGAFAFTGPMQYIGI